ncbi:hypothetical protein [Nitrosomonas sp. Nm33]|uniref:hypothetical protein n=1 Tax=Nitrosomonas sp. Nm33 TaxID=133724 RepID=UPI0008946FD7|nr:hypothetical protein [Nitrosomonas sp. Nm33]SDY65319.1 hypothetical protein SAMN05421755_103624 [Nitrosomonas sp. Nm33]
MPRGLTENESGKVICDKGDSFHHPWGDTYLWAATRYVELNPVWVKMVAKAEDYSWSSAVTQCGLKEGTILSQKPEKNNAIKFQIGQHGWRKVMIPRNLNCCGEILKKVYLTEMKILFEDWKRMRVDCCVIVL